MPVRTRLSLSVALLVTVLLALTAVAVGCLWSLQLPGVAVTAAVAGIGAVVAVVFAYGLARELPEDAELMFIEPPPRVPVVPVPTRRIESAPIAQLPPQYLAAVMKGVQARHAAFRAEAQSQAEAR